MKKILFTLALLISFSSFGQSYEEFNFSDLKRISSEKQWKRFAFEKGFTRISSSEYSSTYALSYDSDSKEANIWAYYYPKSGVFEMTLVKNIGGTPNKSYESVLKQVKRECVFFDFIEDSDKEYICYTCKNSSYPGKIGFSRGKDGSDYIKIFLPYRFN